MLGIHRIADRGVAYYLDDMASEVAFGRERAEGNARWVGTAAAGLGCQGVMAREAFEAALEGRHPTAPHRLRTDRASVAGYDLTFSAPKSASVLFALGGEEVAQAVVAAHRGAVSAALTYVEAHALSTRRGSGEARAVLATTGLVAGCFTHGVNRNLDPHLHTHIVAANLVHGADGRWGACDQRGLWAHRQACGAAYDAHLRSDLTARVGVAWCTGANGRTEISGVSPQLLGEFSSRSADIRRHMASVGTQTSRGARVAWAVTRAPKGDARTYGALAEHWARRAEGCGQSRAGLVAELGAPVGLVAAPVLDEHRFRASLSNLADGSVRRRDVVAALADAAPSGMSVRTTGRLADLWVERCDAVGVAEPRHTPRSVVPADHVLAALGPRPLDAGAHEVWRGGALAIETYRRRWGVTPSHDALGVSGSAVAGLGHERLVDHLATVRVLDVARRQLGWRAPGSLDLARGR